MLNFGCRVKNDLPVYVAEIERFEGGLLYVIHLDSSGGILKATTYIDELRGDVDVTSFVRDNEFWKERVAMWLEEKIESDRENWQFKAHKGF
jgi:hypothetical protein